MTEPCPTCGPEFLHWLAADTARSQAWRALPRRQLLPGAAVQAMGQPVVAVWFVEQGLLRSHFVNAQGRERNCAFHDEGQWAGQPPTRGTASPATMAIEALERSQVVELHHAALAGWLRDRPELQARLTDALSANLLAMSRRESSLLMDTAEQRYLRFVADQPQLAARLPLHQVASYLGITNVALSRVRRRLREREPMAP